MDDLFEWVVQAIMVGGLSSAGRAPALQAGGHRFDPDRLHHFDTPEMKTTYSAVPLGIAVLQTEDGLFFDIVNGFFNRCRGCIVAVPQGIVRVANHTFISK